MTSPDIAGARVVWLSVPRPSGPPHTTPVWFVLIEDRIWIASSIVNRKVQLIAGDPHVSLAVDGSTRDPQVAQGIATIHDDLAALPRVVAALAAKYPGWDPADPAQDGPRVLVEVAIDRWLMGGHVRLGGLTCHGQAIEVEPTCRTMGRVGVARHSSEVFSAVASSNMCSMTV